VEIPRPDNLGSKNSFEISRLSGGDSGIGDNRGGVNDIVNATLDAIDIGQGVLERFPITNIYLTVLAACLDFFRQGR
jgi:hypothetical protein